MTPPAKWRKPIRRVSKVRARDNRVYSKLRRTFLDRNPFCQCCVLLHPGLQPMPSDDVHHKQGRGKLLNDITKWMAICRQCHDHVHRNPKWAMERGVILSRLSK